MSLNLYNFFHLNLAYSAIEEEDRLEVIERCYWPLLQLAARHDLPFGIELSGYTLETITELAPDWIVELRRLITEGPCELIGCGYAQVIGPLVPSEIIAANLRIGHKVYEQILGIRPNIALLNEQAYSAGLVPLYLEAGYEAIIMEWDNPARGHPEWDPEYRYLPQRAQGSRGEQISLIWNKSIGFQKFQRYAHGELELEELLEYVRGHISDHVRVFPVYGNDIEIFDYRPGRYMTEASIQEEGEWKRIDVLYQALLGEAGMQFVRPSEVLGLRAEAKADQLLRLESAAQPIPVKKQDKYNIVRWAVTGRDDLGINTRCWRIFEGLKKDTAPSAADWKALCYLWSSDFRTHITDKRWKRYIERLESFEARLALKTPKEATPESSPGHLQPAITVEKKGRMLEVRGERLVVRLNCQRGLALDAFTDLTVSTKPLCGTLHHGYFDDIGWGADYYSGHLVFESPGQHKITDLSPVEPQVTQSGGLVHVTATISTPLGPVEKHWVIDDRIGRLQLSYQIDWSKPTIGSLRLAHITLMPEAFMKDKLCYQSHNGGQTMETALLGDGSLCHGQAVSSLISARQAVGMTNGIVTLGDTHRRIQLTSDKQKAALIAMVDHQRVDKSHFTRVALSAREVDDTSRAKPVGILEVDCEIGVMC